MGKRQRRRLREAAAAAPIPVPEPVPEYTVQAGLAESSGTSGPEQEKKE